MQHLPGITVWHHCLAKLFVITVHNIIVKAAYSMESSDMRLCRHSPEMMPYAASQSSADNRVQTTCHVVGWHVMCVCVCARSILRTLPPSTVCLVATLATVQSISCKPVYCKQYHREREKEREREEFSLQQ